MSNWVAAYKRDGSKGLKSLGKPGPKPKRAKKIKQERGFFKLGALVSTHIRKAGKPAGKALSRVFKLFGTG